MLESECDFSMKLTESPSFKVSIAKRMVTLSYMQARLKVYTVHKYNINESKTCMNYIRYYIVVVVVFVTGPGWVLKNIYLSDTRIYLTLKNVSVNYNRPFCMVPLHNFQAFVCFGTHFPWN